MKRILIVVLSVVLIFLLLLSLFSKKVNPEITSYRGPEEVIEDFFKYFAIQDYEGMKQFCTTECVENFFHDGDVFGYEKAELISCQKNDNIITQDDEYWFLVYLEIIPSPKSSIYPSETAYIDIVLENIDNKWFITRFETG